MTIAPATSLPTDVYAAFHRRLVNLYAQHFRPILLGTEHLRQMTDDSLDERRSIAQLELFERLTGRTLRGLRVLEVGSGVGMTVAMARKRFGAEAFGIEPATHEYEGTFAVSRDLLAAYGLDAAAVTMGVGEQLPFPDGHFDAVISSNVLEHVQDPQRVLSESLRVLRTQGLLQFVIPNYGSWWEGHYGVLWIPHMPARAAKLYLRLLGRDPSYVDTLQLITRGRLESWLKPYRDRVEILDWGAELWAERVRGLAFAEYATLRRLKRLLHTVHALGLVNVLVRVGQLAHWETPLVLTLRKRG
jgi:SAM-dependent methyltransferase